MAERVDAAVLEALSHPVRLALLVALERGGEQTAAELAAGLDASEGEVQQQIAALHERGFVVDGTTPRHVRVSAPGWDLVATHLSRLRSLNPDDDPNPDDPDDPDRDA
ncbi:MAG TPA: winged helix-turn-helix domain-containing protein [Baekduia sp.]